MTDNRNTILAVILSGLVLIAWQYFYNVPQMEKQRARTRRRAELQEVRAAAGARHRRHGRARRRSPAAPRPRPRRRRGQCAGRQPRCGDRGHAARQDRDPAPDRQHLAEGRAHRRPVAGQVPRDRRSRPRRAIVLFSPSGTAAPYYAEFGWVPAAGSTVAAARPEHGVAAGRHRRADAVARRSTLKYDNGEGLTFRRTIAVDDRYLFTIKDEVTNVGNAPVTLYPFALISRHGTPQVSGYYILHEGLIGYLGDQGLQEYTYKKIDDAKPVQLQRHQRLARHHRQILGLGAAARHHRAVAGALLVQPGRHDQQTYQTDYLQDAQTDPIGGTGTANARLFAGAKEASVVGINFPLVGLGGYNKQLGLNHFDLLIDWGWFYFITKPMFLALDFFYHLVGNFGIAILLVTVLVKLLFFPLANKSYASMAKMKSVQPQLPALKERYPDDKVKQQQEMMEIYKKEKINPIAGCLPVAIADPGVLLALQGAVRHHRNAARAVLRLDQGPVGAGPDQPLQPVRAAALRSDAAAAVRPLPRARRLADHHGHHDVVPDEAQPDAAGSDAEDDLRLDAADLHLHAGGLPGGPRDLLGLEQHAVGDAAELHHAPQRREGGTVRQSQGNVRLEEGEVEDVTIAVIASAARQSGSTSARPGWIASPIALRAMHGDDAGSLRMTTDTDAELIEQGRKLFAGDWQFVWASPSIETLPPMAGLEVAFAGRSNVGKSRLINALTGRNALARTSHTPGRTQELIFFEGPDKAGLRLVDMPGYGYAAAPKAKVASWTALIHKFLQGRAIARAGLCADRRAPRPQGCRSRRAEDARQGRGQLSGRADQGRPGQGGRA